MNIIFRIEGGIGKNIAATAVCRAIKLQYPNDRLIVITGHPAVFLGNPHVYRALSYNNLNYFYQEYIENQEVKAFLHNPYFDTGFINLKGHLNEVWCEMFGIKCDGVMPDIMMNQREQDFFGKNFQTQKPIFVIQTNGGAENQPIKYSWSREVFCS